MEFMNFVKNAKTGIVNLTGVEYLDEDGEGGFIEGHVAIHDFNGGEITYHLDLAGQ